MFQKFCRGAFQIFAPLLAVVALGVESRAGQLSLRWTDTSSDEAGFQIERRTGTGGTYAQIATAQEQRVGMREAETDHGLVRRHQCEVRGSFEVTGVVDGHRPHSRIVREFHRVPHPLGSRGVAERVVPVEAPDPRPAGLEAVGRLRIQPTGLHRLQVMRQQTDTVGVHSANGSLNEPFRIA